MFYPIIVRMRNIDNFVSMIGIWVSQMFEWQERTRNIAWDLYYGVIDKELGLMVYL